jgi:hypothetical protein
MVLFKRTYAISKLSSQHMGVMNQNKIGSFTASTMPSFFMPSFFVWGCAGTDSAEYDREYGRYDREYGRYDRKYGRYDRKYGQYDGNMGNMTVNMNNLPMTGVMICSIPEMYMKI